MHYSSLPPTYTSNSECKRCTQIEASSVSLLNQAKCRHKLFKWQAPLRDLQAHNATNANPVQVLLCTDWGQVKWCSSFARLCFTHTLSFLRENMNRQRINPPLHPSKSRREIQKKMQRKHQNISLQIQDNPCSSVTSNSPGKGRHPSYPRRSWLYTLLPYTALAILGGLVILYLRPC